MDGADGGYHETSKSRSGTPDADRRRTGWSPSFRRTGTGIDLPGADALRSAPPSATVVPLAPSEICAPAEIAARIDRWSLAKTLLPLDRLLLLGLLAGAYIGFGAALATIVASDGVLGYGLTRWTGGIAFSLGLVLVVIGGAELSTGNCLMALAWRNNVVTPAQIWRNWTCSFIANCLGAVLLAWAITRSGVFDAAAVRQTLTRAAETKFALSFEQAFLRGILCNMLVCLAVWLTFATQTVIGKLVGIVFPISAFVALGFEHSVANCFILPAALLIGAPGTFESVIANLIPVTQGNLVGGALCVAMVLARAHVATPPPADH